MLAGFRRHLVGKTDKCFSLWCRWNTLCWQTSNHTDIFINQRIKCYLNSTINVRPLTPNIMPCYTHKMTIVSWPQILWRHFTLCTCILAVQCGNDSSTRRQNRRLRRHDNDECTVDTDRRRSYVPPPPPRRQSVPSIVQLFVLHLQSVQKTIRTPAVGGIVAVYVAYILQPVGQRARRSKQWWTTN